MTLPQAAIMILEGERKQFTMTIRNTSATTAVDFVHISFQDSATLAIQTAISNKDLPAAELHELEVQLAHYPSLRWCKSSDEESLKIQPGEEMDFTVEIVGRIRLTDAIIQIDYANLGKRRSEVDERFFTRQVSVPISITVNASVQLQRPDIVSLSGDFGHFGQQDWVSRAATANAGLHKVSADTSSGETDAQLQTNYPDTQLPEHDNEKCMLLLDLRNSWPNPLSISLQARHPSTDENDQADPWSDANAVHEVIQPGHTNRVVMILPKIYLERPHAAVPSLNPANQRQFIVSTSKISPEVERASREAFWYRHELLKLIRGTWKEESSGRHGTLELRGIRFSARMVESIKLEDIKLDMNIVSGFTASHDDSGSILQRLSRTKFGIPVDEFLTLRTTVTNRSSHPISPLLRLQPQLAGLPHNIALDLDKRFSWSGVLQSKLPTIHPGDSVVSELGIVALCSGTFEIDATVEEIGLFAGKVESKQAGEGEGGGGGGGGAGDGGGIDGSASASDAVGSAPRQRSATQTLLEGDILGVPQLRTWHSKESCTVVARRVEDVD